MYDVVRSWKPVELAKLVCVSPEPDLVELVALMSRLPTAVAVNPLNTVSLEPSTDPDVDGSTLIAPPPLKKALIVLLFANVTDLSSVEVEFHVAPLVLVPTAFVPNAVAFGEPAATEAASVAKSAATAALMAMGSPADTADLEVIVSLV